MDHCCPNIYVLWFAPFGSSFQMAMMTVVVVAAHTTASSVQHKAHSSAKEKYHINNPGTV
jgi:hemolysin-activating ACP:hemolysin acyltransferase